MPDDEWKELIVESCWQRTPYVLALGIQSDGHTDRDLSRAPHCNEQFYFIRNSECHHSNSDNSLDEDYDEDSPITMLLHNPPSFTVAKLKELPGDILDRYHAFPQYVAELEVETLSIWPPKIMDTGIMEKNGKPVRVGANYPD